MVRLLAIGTWCGFALLLVGCFPQSITTKQLHFLKQLQEPADANALYLQTVLLERSVGDGFLQEGVWTTTVRPLSHEMNTLFAKNGLRVGVLTGLIPGEFAEAIRSEHGTIQPMHRTFQEGVARIVPVQGPLDRTSFKLLRDLAADPAPLELTQAECGFQVTLFPVGKDRVRLVFHPQMQHGDKQPLFKPSADGTEFTRVDQKLSESCETLQCEVTLSGTDYLIVGPTAEPVETLGGTFFITSRGDKVRQRLLVIRAGRGATHAEADVILGRTANTN